MATKAILLLVIVQLVCTAAQVVEISGTDETPTDEGGDSDQTLIDVTGKDTATKAPRVIPDDGYLPNWCGTAPGLSCPKHADIGVYQESDYNACLYRCQDLSCLGAEFTDGECRLSSERCSPDELVAGSGIYYRRLKEGEEACPTGTSPIGLDDNGPSSLYCKGVGVECDGGDIYDGQFAPTVRQCLTRCNTEPRCRTAHYNDKICHLRSRRCTQEQLEEKAGALDFYRLMKGEVCPPLRPLYVEEVVPYTGKFCMAPNKRCVGHALYRKPQNIHPLEQCLIKCTRIKTCGSVDFANNRCDPKDYRCSDAELDDVFGSMNLMRLEEGEDCPTNRKPPPENTAWSAKFCAQPKKICPGALMEGSPFPSPDYIDCLSKCVKSEGCQTALLNEDHCSLMDSRCEADQYETHAGISYFRLRNSEACPEETIPPTCQEYAVFKPDAPACPNTCKEPAAWINCDLATLPGCVCDEGYVKREDSDDCMPMSQCDCYDHEGTMHELGNTWRTVDCHVTFECRLNELDVPTIEQAATPCDTNEVCEESSCVCAPGYLKRDSGCEPSITCQEHSYFRSDASTTPNICHHTTREAANSDTAPGCDCNQGYILDKEDGKCVPYVECGCQDSGEHIFTAGDRWLSVDCDKENTCDPVVDSFPVINSIENDCPSHSTCKSEAGRGECVCDEGHTKEIDGTCRTKCVAPRVFDASASTCPDTCRLPTRSDSCETSAPACVCPDAQILNEANQCVDKEECPCYDEAGEKKLPGEQWMTNDCGAIETCYGEAGETPTISSTPHACQEDAVCDTDSGFPQCICGDQFELAEDGKTCLPVLQPCDDMLNEKVKLFVEEIKALMHDGCGSCSNTCKNPTGALKCPLSSKVCNCQQENYLFDEITSQCVPANECSCYDVKGTPHQPGSTWLSDDCTQVRSCVSTCEKPPEITTTMYVCGDCDGHGTCLDAVMRM